MKSKIWLPKDYEERYEPIKEFKYWLLKSELGDTFPKKLEWYHLGYLTFKPIVKSEIEKAKMIGTARMCLLFNFCKNEHFIQFLGNFSKEIISHFKNIYPNWNKLYFLFLEILNNEIQIYDFEEIYIIYEDKILELIRKF